MFKFGGMGHGYKNSLFIYGRNGLCLHSPELMLEVRDPGVELRGDVGDPEKEEDRGQAHRGHNARGGGAEAGAREDGEQEAGRPASGVLVPWLVASDMTGGPRGGAVTVSPTWIVVVRVICIYI